MCIYKDTGSSILFGVYLAGCVLSYISQPPSEITSLDDNEVQSRLEALSFEHAFSRLAGPIQQYLMTPLFFASIGFAIVCILSYCIPVLRLMILFL